MTETGNEHYSVTVKLNRHITQLKSIACYVTVEVIEAARLSEMRDVIQQILRWQLFW